MATSRVKFQKDIEQRLRTWGTRHGAIETKVAKAEDDAKAALFAELGKLRTLEAEGRRCLSVVETAGAAAWARLQTDFVERWERVNRAAEAVWARVK
ncbi:MAG: hypothetical protein M0R80_30840 [Proteobacteria bacterium]|nr:hypothetical protein [Pseudomonadota bacterium]